MNFSEQITIIRQSIRLQNRGKDNSIRLVSSDKWRLMMLRCLEKFKKKNIYDTNMVDDLSVIVNRIPEDKFVQATLNMQPFKPSFSDRNKKDQKNKSRKTNSENAEEENHCETKLAKNPKLKQQKPITQLKQTVHEKMSSMDEESHLQKHRKSFAQKMLSLVTKESTLIKEFQTRYHPYKKIIQQFLSLLQGKYKMILDSSANFQIEEIQEKLITDVRLLQDFIVKSSQPYLIMLKAQNSQEKETFQIKLIAFVRQYIEKHQKVNQMIRKIMKSASRKCSTIKLLSQSLPDFVDIQNYDVPEKYKIEGCYVHSMSALMDFCGATTARSCLQKLQEFRASIGKDLDHYYASQKQGPVQLEISAETQLQILKFILSKMKSFLCEIFAQLKYLQVICGQEDMSFKFDDSSYMYAQLTVTFQALEIDGQQSK